jgi:Fe-S oxidoreductase
MPAHKAEFLYHHWKGRLRPRHAYAFGLIDQVSRLSSLQPGLVNALTHTPPFTQALQLLAGMSRKRRFPRFAPLTLCDWFFSRRERNLRGPTLVLWPDTFNNYFHTDVGMAAVEALEAAGWRVTMPRRHVCCGRPLYDYGFLGLAKRYLTRVIEELRPAIRAGIPVVGLEPSCLATFKSELPRLLPHDDDARRLREQSYHFAAFLKAHEVPLPRLRREALLWGHCHQKATGGIEPDLEVLERMGVEAERVTGGCCGLAGSWGFESGHHGISMECGEQALLPAIRGAAATTLIVADGFSCKRQIAQAETGRTALHLAQVIEMAQREARDMPAPRRLPERSAGGRPRPGVARRLKRAAGLGAVGGLALAALRLGMR